MKILVLSLLRIGDIVLAAPALRGLRDKYPSAEIHLLVNSQFVRIAPLLPYIDKLVPFDREALQKGLGSYETPFFESYERLSAIIDRLNGTGYDAVVNLTQSRLSGWILSLLEAKEKIGLCFDGHGKASFSSSWFRYLNSQVGSEGSEVFHFSDVFRFALDLEVEAGSNLPLLVESQRGIDEAEAFLKSISVDGLIGRPPYLAVQALTSDEKKDWGISRFIATASEFASRHPEAAIVFLSAPFEAVHLEPAVWELRQNGVRAELAIVSFEGAFSIVKRAKAVLSGDTSVLHLACAARVPVIELSLGSSDPYRTGAYAHGSVIIQSKESCAPCVHSKPCHRERHFCALRIDVAPVAMIASEVFSRRSFQLKAIAEEYASEVEVLCVRSKNTGFWAAVSVLEPFTEETVARWIDLTCRKIWLQGNQTGRGPDSLGSEILRLAGFLKEIHPTTSDIEWKHMLDLFERQAALVESRINGFKVGVRVLHGSFDDPKRMREFVSGLIAFRERIRHVALLSSFKNALDQVIEDDISPAFTRFRRIIDVVAEIETRTNIYLRLIRALNRQVEEAQGLERT